MKKEYVSPQIDIISTKMEDALLAGSDGKGTTPPIKAKDYSGDIDDFSDESMWGNETDGYNE